MPSPEPTRSAAPRAFESVVAWVEQRILEGKAVVGDLLPAERDLAAHLGVGRSAVREGVKALQAIGVVTSRVGAGAAGGTVISAVPSSALSRFLRMHVALAQFPMPDVVEVRCALEALSARLAACHVTAEQLRSLAALVTDMEDPDLDREAFNDLDTAFHVAIAEAAGNVLATDLTVAIRESVREPIRRGLDDVDDWPALRERLAREHREVFDALAARDGERAAELLDAHVRSAVGRILGQ